MSAMSGVSLAIQVVELACKALIFIQRAVKDSKTFGNDVQSLRTQIVTETARLLAFLAFLKHKSPSGETQFDQLPDLTKKAVLGNVQELGILFAQYTTVVTKYGVEELMRGYGADLVPDSQTDIFGATLAEEGITERRDIQREARVTDVATWGLFKRKNVIVVADKLALWNDRLMKLLLCGLCFGKNLPPWHSVDNIARENLTKLQVSTGLTLRELILETNIDNTSILKNDLVFLEPSSNSKTQMVAEPSGGSALCYIEYKTYDLPARRPNDRITIERACNLARLLQHPNASEAGFHTLYLRCVVHQKKPSTRFAFVFDLPTGVDLKPITLLQAIRDREVSGDSLMRPTLGQRFRIARSLSETLFQFHSVGWLHKSIRSENILLFPGLRDPGGGGGGDERIEYHCPYLVGFEFSRDVLDRSNTEQDGLLERNIYRHPDRQGSPTDEKDPDRPFSLLYDIYALGVVLLEVGLWRSATGFEDWDDTSMKPDEIKEALEEHAKQRLPHYMGQDYADMVVGFLRWSFFRGGVAGGAPNDVEREKILMAYYQETVAGIESGLSLK